MSVDLYGDLRFTSDTEDIEEAIIAFEEFLTWTKEQGWGEEHIYRVAKMSLALLEFRS